MLRRRPIRFRRRFGFGGPVSTSVYSSQGTEFIRWVQSSLNQVLGLNLVINGIMDQATRNGVREFQRQRGVPVDGIVGPETKQALISARAGDSGGSAAGDAEPAGSAEPMEPSEPSGQGEPSAPPEPAGGGDAGAPPDSGELDEIAAMLDEMTDEEFWGSMEHDLDEIGWDSESLGYSGISCITPGNPYVLHCFPPFKTELTREQHRHLDIIAEKIRKSFTTSRPITKVRILGHSSTWHATSRTQLEEHAIRRAGNAANELILRLNRMGLAKRVDIEADGVSDTVPWRGKSYSSTDGSRASQNDRALNRRVEIWLLVPRRRKTPRTMFA
jgi:outer membrane protein OmpA-like peptidoglycan-associated protein